MDRQRAAGGIVEYLAQAYGIGLFSGALSILLYLSALVALALALVAKTFGSYALALLAVEGDSCWVYGLADFVIIAFVLVNLEGAASVAAMGTVGAETGRCE